MAVDLAEATRAVEALLPGLEVAVERPTSSAYRVVLRRGDRCRVAELFPGPEDTAKAFEAWVANPDEDPLGLTAWFRTLADRVTDRPEPLSLAAVTLTCPRCGHRDLRRRFPLDTGRRTEAVPGWPRRHKEPGHETRPPLRFCPVTCPL